MATTDDRADSTQGKLDQLEQLRDEAEHAAGEQAVERQRQQGKLLARERLVELLDPGSFVELDRYVRHRESNFGMLDRRPYGDAVCTGDGTIEGAGGTSTHASKSGVAHFISPDEKACLEDARYLISFLPQNNLDPPPFGEPSDARDREEPELDRLIPDNPNKPYDMHDVVRRIVDDGEFFEVHELWAENVICGLARLGGHPVGVVGNQPRSLAGVLDIDSSVKAARFVRFCDGFNIPLVTFVDVPGFLPGTQQEWGGIIRHGAKLLYAYAEATVPKLTVITRKAYG